MSTNVRRLMATSVLTAGVILGVAAPASAAPAPTKFKNCTALHAVYKHGVGKSAKAHDKVSSHAKPKHGFKISARVYNANKKLDRDKDGIACEA